MNRSIEPFAPASRLWRGLSLLVSLMWLAAAAESVTAAPPRLGLTFTNAIRMRMVWIPAGSFLHGSPTNEADRFVQEPVSTTVTVSNGFWMAEHEVTRAEWRPLMPGPARADAEADPLPVDGVTWEEATEFCRRLTEVERTAGRLPPGHAYHLPTSVQWEYACRAGTTTRFGFGDDLDAALIGEYAWHEGNSRGHLQGVGHKKPNRWGLYDTHGNVWEWCDERVDAGATATVLGVEPGAGAGLLHLCRGGGAGSPARLLRSASRAAAPDGASLPGVGLRVALVNRPPEFASDTEKLSYAMGVIFALGLVNEGFKVDPATLARGISDAYAQGSEQRLSGDQAQSILDEYRERKARAGSGVEDARVRAAQIASDRFLAENAARSGVKLLANGVQHEILTPGDGSLAGPDEAVSVRILATRTFEGRVVALPQQASGAVWLIPGAPEEVPGLLDGAYPLPVGTRCRVFVPAALAGPGANPQPDGEALPAGLIHEVQVLAIQPKGKALSERLRRQVEANRTAGEAFLRQFASQPGVQVLENGLRYRELRPGSGPSPSTNDWVDVHWKISLVDGTELTNSASSPVPVPLQMREVAKSFRGVFEALSRMQPGSRWELAIPPELAYGEQGRAPKVPPASTLRCELEILQVHPGEVGSAAR